MGYGDGGTNGWSDGFVTGHVSGAPFDRIFPADSSCCFAAVALCPALIDIVVLVHAKSVTSMRTFADRKRDIVASGP